MTMPENLNIFGDAIAILIEQLGVQIAINRRYGAGETDLTTGRVASVNTATINTKGIVSTLEPRDVGGGSAGGVLMHEGSMTRVVIYPIPEFAESAGGGTLRQGDVIVVQGASGDELFSVTQVAKTTGAIALQAMCVRM
jgi:hypothetical protein